VSLAIALGLAVTGGGSGGGASSPLTILSDVALWIRSDKSWTVSAFPDQSGLSNSLAAGVNWTINTADADFNGHNSAQFDGTTQWASLAAFTRGTGPDFFVWAVMRLISAGSFPMMFSEGAGNHEFRCNAAGGTPMMSAGAISVTAIWGSSIVGSTKAVSAYDIGAGTVGVNVSNGTPVTTGTTSHGMTDGGIAAAIGARPGGSTFANFKFAEMVICTTMPSAGQLAALQTYATTTAQGTGYGSV
jgi:hypothetical protein